MKRRTALLALLVVILTVASAWWASDWIESGYRWFFPHPERYQIVALPGMPAFVRLNTRTGSLAIYVVTTENQVQFAQPLRAVNVGYEPGSYR